MNIFCLLYQKGLGKFCTGLCSMRENGTTEISLVVEVLIFKAFVSVSNRCIFTFRGQTRGRMLISEFCTTYYRVTNQIYIYVTRKSSSANLSQLERLIRHCLISELALLDFRVTYI